MKALLSLKKNIDSNRVRKSASIFLSSLLNKCTSLNISFFISPLFDSFFLLVIQDALRAHQLLLKEKERRLLREENEERERVIAEGGDPDVAILRKRQLEQLEKDKQYVLLMILTTYIILIECICNQSFL